MAHFKIYLDVSCLNRPFDDQEQARIRLESGAVAIVLAECEAGRWRHVSSQMSTIEINAMPDVNRRKRVELLLPSAAELLILREEVFTRAADLEILGFKAADAVHVAAAESLQADVLLSCDDRLVKNARRRHAKLTVHVANPLDWLKEIGHDADA